MHTLNRKQVHAYVDTLMKQVTLFLLGVAVGIFGLAAYINMQDPGVLPYSNMSGETKPLVVKVTNDPCPGDEYVPEHGPCVWDARHMGNGEGKSFWISKAGAFRHVRHVRAHCMLRPHVAGECRELARVRIWQIG